MKNHVGPRIGAKVYAGTGVTLIGTITMEDNVTAGTGRTIMESVHKDAVVAGIPARGRRLRTAHEDSDKNRIVPNRVPGWLMPDLVRGADFGRRGIAVTRVSPGPGPTIHTV